MGKRPVTVIIAVGRAETRAALRARLVPNDGSPDDSASGGASGGAIEVCAEAQEPAEIPALTCAHRPDVILIDLPLHQKCAPEIREAIARFGAPKIVLVSASPDDALPLDDIMSGSVSGAVPIGVSANDLGAALHDVKAGRLAFRSGKASHPASRRGGKNAPHEALTAREHEILREIASGKNNNTIAADLGLSKGTVKGHVSTILSKLGVDNRALATLYAVRNKLV